MKFGFRFLLIALFLLSTIHVAFSHSGRTDSYGCHTNHSTGEYHCHGTKKTETNSSKTLRSPSSINMEESKANQYCCKVCKAGYACGDSCISRSKTCHQPAGCACDG